MALSDEQVYNLNNRIRHPSLKVPLGDVVRAAETAVLTAAAAGTDGVLADQIARVTYDFAVNGGAIGDIPLAVSLPAKAIIKQVWLDILTQPTSGGSATVALKLESAADLMVATAIASLTTGRYDGKPNGAAANTTKTTVARAVTVTVATAALTAGKFVVFAEYFIGG